MDNKGAMKLRIFWSLQLLLLALGSFLPCAQAQDGTTAESRPRPARRWALLVGVDTYESDSMNPLRFAVADTKEVQAALLDAGYGEESIFTMTSDAKGPDYPSSANVLRRLNGLSGQVQPQDTFVFYFSGHGFQGEAGHFLATADADPTDAELLEKTSLPLKLLQRKMQGIAAKKAIFIIDACRNDPIKGAKSAGGNTLTEDFSRDLRLVARSTGGGQSGVAILLSCSAGERSWEWGEKGQGAFTFFLAEGLRTTAKAGTEVRMADLGYYVQQKMADWGLRQNKTQTPDLQQFGAAHIVLAPGAPAAPANAVAPAPAPQPTPTRQKLKALEDIYEILRNNSAGKATVRLSSTPPGAQVWINGKPTGKLTPCQVAIDMDGVGSRLVEVGFTMKGREWSLQHMWADTSEPKELKANLPALSTLHSLLLTTPEKEMQAAHEFLSLIGKSGTFTRRSNAPVIDESGMPRPKETLFYEAGVASIADGTLTIRTSFAKAKEGQPSEAGEWLRKTSKAPLKELLTKAEVVSMGAVTLLLLRTKNNEPSITASFSDGRIDTSEREIRIPLQSKADAERAAALLKIMLPMP